jgi:hypothetical protein
MTHQMHWVIEFEDELLKQTNPPMNRRIAHALGMSLYDPKEDPLKAAGDWAAFRRSLRADLVRGTSQQPAKLQRRLE